MNKINWKVRFQNKQFWVTFISAICLIVTQVLQALQIQLDVNIIEESLLNIINTVFAALTVGGVMIDPTTEGITDSTQVLGREEIVKKEKIEESVEEFLENEERGDLG